MAKRKNINKDSVDNNIVESEIVTTVANTNVSNNEVAKIDEHEDNKESDARTITDDATVDSIMPTKKETVKRTSNEENNVVKPKSKKSCYFGFTWNGQEFE